MRSWAAIALTLCLCFTTRALCAPRALSVPLTPRWTSTQALIIPVQSAHSVARVRVPPMSAPSGGVMCLRFRAHIASTDAAGWGDYLHMSWNGRSLGPRTHAGRARVLNRHDAFRTGRADFPLVSLASVRDGLPCFTVFFGPSAEAIEADVLTDRDEGTWYLIDISDLASGAPNELDFTNLALRRNWPNGVPPGTSLVIDDLVLGTLPQSAVDQMSAAKLTQRPMMPVHGSHLQVRCAGGGGLQVSLRGETYFIESAFSFPHSPTMGFNRISCEREASGEAGWRPQRMATHTADVQADSRRYHVARHVTVTDDRIVVQERLTNRTHAILGVAVRHSLITQARPECVRLGGLDTATLDAATMAENPTVFVAQRKTGLGMVAEDDASRLQSFQRAVDNTVELGTDRLGLAPKQSYTIRRTFYLGTPDYFDFINRLRRDWKVNFTVDGPFDFFDARTLASPAGREAARRLILRKKLKIFALYPWFEYFNGWTMDRKAYQKTMQDARSFIRSVVPDARCLACIETNLVPVDLSFFRGTIPHTWPIPGHYGETATRAMTACVDASPWRDSCVRDADGNVLIDCQYVQHYRSRPAVNLIVYPTAGNHRQQNALEQIAWLLDDVGLDGVYIDQFSLGWNDHVTRYSQERWDGRTVSLAADGRIQRLCCDTGLISAAARRVWLETVLRRGKTVVCNTNATLATLQRVPAFRFMETQGYDPMENNGMPPALSKGQLGSPLGLGYPFPSVSGPRSPGADVYMRTVIAHLRAGLLYYYNFTEFPPHDENGRKGGAFGPLTHMFPFTPIELHSGWILGKERLITCVSGHFPWPSSRRPRVIQFDSRGRVMAARATITRAGEGYRVTIHLRDGWAVAVIE